MYRTRLSAVNVLKSHVSGVYALYPRGSLHDGTADKIEENSCVTPDLHISIRLARFPKSHLKKSSPSLENRKTPFRALWTVVSLLLSD